MPFLAKLPQQIAYPLASLYGRLSLQFRGEEEKAIKAWMKLVVGYASDTQIDEWTRYLLLLTEREVLDTWYFRKLTKIRDIDQFVSLKNFEPLLAARQAGRKVMITSGHFGRFWMAGVGMKAHGISVGTITRDGGTINKHGLNEQEYQYRLKKLQWLQERFSGPFLVEGDSVRAIYRALDEHVMAVFIDVAYSSPKEGRYTGPFLGKTGQFPMGIARIAKRTGALVFPFYVFETKSGLEARYYDPLDAEQFTEEELMAQLIATLETQILQNPQLWWLWPALPQLWTSV